MRRVGYFFLFWGILAASSAGAEVDNFSVRGRAGLSYDDNVTFADENEKDDLVQSVLVGFDGRLETSRNRFLAQFDLSRNFYFDNSSFNNTVVAARASNTFEVSPRLRLKASNDFRRADEPSSFEDALGRPDGRYRVNKNIFDLGADFEVNSFTLAQFTYGHEYTGYSRSELTDTDMHRVGGRVQYEFDEANRVGAGYDYSLRFFETGNEVSYHTIFADYGRHLTRQLSLTLKAGQDFIDSDLSGRSRQARYEAELANELDAATRASLKYRRGLSTYAYSQELFDSYRWTVTLGKELTPRLMASCNAFYGEGEYELTLIRDRLSGFGGGLNYALTPVSTVGGSYSYSNTDSNQGTRSYTRNLFTLFYSTRF